MNKASYSRTALFFVCLSTGVPGTAQEPGSPSVQRLISDLRSTDGTTRTNAATALSALGPEARGAVPALTIALKDPVNQVRITARKALRRIGPATVSQAVQDDGVEKWKALFTADDAKNAPPLFATQASEKLIMWLKDCDSAKRARAANALGWSKSDEAVIPLLDLLEREKDQRVVWAAVFALGNLEARAGKGVPSLIRILEDEASTQVERSIAPIPEIKNLRAWVAISLARIGEPASKALLEVLHDQRHSVALRITAGEALSSMGVHASSTIPGLLELLSDSNADIRLQVLAILGNIGPRAKVAIPALDRAVADSSPLVRIGTALALYRIAPGSPTIGHTLISALKESDGEVRWQAANAIALIGPDADQTVSTLVNMLIESDPRNRLMAAFALGEIGPKAKAAIKSLKKLSRDENEVVRQRAKDAIKKIDRNE